ncbi:hypothetical protein M408DRAFT_290299 [Serendipita vermifera MAFF 305830]|uniref:Uncharacterized protein n=1 Tax=Serendipita vermifera MAFF 305830 TaxID=933852 RepID=A0A0C2WPW4_SERVB|nr:hypothetical protein M408DRAFT_193980 [Serendipita vermifera MAFF 305830]KIM22404.1 hypothetical protein M408DRAFT_290299 [Serendipita vermifera MAFF 305830]
MQSFTSQLDNLSWHLNNPICVITARAPPFLIVDLPIYQRGRVIRVSRQYKSPSRRKSENDGESCPKTKNVRVREKESTPRMCLRASEEEGT